MERKLAVKTMVELYPGVSAYHAELVYDFCKNTPEAELKEIMKKVEEEPSRFIAEPGESFNMEILPGAELRERPLVATE